MQSRRLFWLVGYLLALRFWLVLLIPALPVEEEVLEFVVKVFQLSLAQREGLPVDEVLDCVEHIHGRVVRLIFVVLDGFSVGSEELLRKLVVTSLMELQVHDSTQDFEQVFDDIFSLSSVLA